MIHFQVLFTNPKTCNGAMQGRKAPGHVNTQTTLQFGMVGWLVTIIVSLLGRILHTTGSHRELGCYLVFKRPFATFCDQLIKQSDANRPGGCACLQIPSTKIGGGDAWRDFSKLSDPLLTAINIINQHQCLLVDLTLIVLCPSYLFLVRCPSRCVALSCRGPCQRP